MIADMTHSSCQDCPKLVHDGGRVRRMPAVLTNCLIPLRTEVQ